MATSLIPAIMDFYAGLSFANNDQKRIFLDKKPQKLASQTAEVTFPYAILEDIGMVPEHMFENNPQEVTTVKIKIYATTLEEVDAMVKTLRFNNQDVKLGAGMDYCTTFSLPSDMATEGTLLQNLVKRLDDQRGPNGSLVYRAELTYVIRNNYV